MGCMAQEIREMSDAEWWLSPQRRKRMLFVERIKESPLYAMQRSQSNADRPHTPEADDKTVSRRSWENSCKLWRHALLEGAG